MGNFSRISVTTYSIFLLAVQIAPSRAVEIPKPVINIPKPAINIPKPNIPRPTINVPKPNVTVNVPKAALNAPRVNAPKADLPKTAGGLPQTERKIPRQDLSNTMSGHRETADRLKSETAVTATEVKPNANAPAATQLKDSSTSGVAPAALKTSGNTTELRLPNGTFGKVVMNPDGTVTLSNNLGSVTLTKQQMSQVAAGDMSALKSLMANGVNSQSLTQSPAVNPNGNVTEISLPNGTFGKVVRNSDGTLTLSNNFGSVTLTPQQMSKVAAGDMSALKPIMGNSAGSNMTGAATSAPISAALGIGTTQNATLHGQPQIKAASVTAAPLPDNNNSAVVGSVYSYTTAYGSYKPQCPNNTCTGTYQGNMSLSDYNALDFSKSGIGLITSPTLKPGIYTVNLNTHGGTSNIYVFVDAPNSVAVNNPVAPTVPNVAVIAGGRQPIYVQDANGVWHNSYWFAPPADVLANYGPLSEASNQPVLPYGFNYPNGPPPNAVFADDSNTNSSRRNANLGDDDPWPNPKNADDSRPSAQEQADNSQKSNNPDAQSSDKADNSQTSDNPRSQDQAGSAAPPGDGSKSADGPSDPSSKSIGEAANDLKNDAKQLAGDLKNDVKQLASPENLDALADANSDATKLREDPVGYLKDKVNEADTAAVKQALTDQLAGPPPSNPEDQDAYKFQQGLVGKAIDNAKQTISDGGQSLKNAISQGWSNFKSIFNFNSNNMDKVSKGANSIKTND